MRTKINSELPNTLKQISITIANARRRAVFAELAIDELAGILEDAHDCSELDVGEAMVQWLLHNRVLEHFPDLVETMNTELTNNGRK